MSTERAEVCSRYAPLAQPRGSWGSHTAPVEFSLRAETQAGQGTKKNAGILGLLIKCQSLTRPTSGL